MSMSAYVDNDNLIAVSGLTNEASGSYINDAAVTCTLYDDDAAEVAGQTWPLTLSYVADSDGIYRGTLEYDLAMTNDTKYLIKIDADGGTGLIGHYEIPVFARTRRK